MIFNGNAAAFGGALNLYSHFLIIFQGGSNYIIAFNNNKAAQNGGAISLQRNSEITFQVMHIVKFHNNEATLGGAIDCNGNSDITLRESSQIILLQNSSKLGGAIYTMISNIIITDNSQVLFTYNIALQDGGAMFLDKHYLVKTHGSESRGQEEAACTRIFWPT